MEQVLQALTGALGGKGRRRTGQPIRRNSYTAGRCEGVFWRSTSRQETQRILLAAKRYELVCREKGCRTGPLGTVAIEILELMANLVSFRTGQLDPSLDTLQRLLKRSRDAVVRALANLRRHGFIDWLRRYVTVDGEGRGPRVKQTSNAYRLGLPDRAKRIVGRLLQSPPIPDDVVQAQEAKETEYKAQLATLTLVEQTRHHAAGHPLEDVLARLAARVEERESVKRSESQAKVF